VTRAPGFPLLFGMALVLATAPAAADSLLPPAEYANRQLPDPRQEAAARELMGEVRCLVCQGQSIADSNAELAGDMRSIIRRRIAAGESPASIRDWLIQRYGDWVSYNPPLDGKTWPLWAAPIVLLILGLLLARGRFRKRRKA
jgi:cytochrome c-type biogenesis protein CcmH